VIGADAEVAHRLVAIGSIVRRTPMPGQDSVAIDDLLLDLLITDPRAISGSAAKRPRTIRARTVR